MFTSISWGNYFVVVALISGAWYIYVGLKYYTDIREFLNGKRSAPFKTAGSFNQLEDPTHKDVDHAIERIKATVADAAQHNTDKEEFMNYMSLLLHEFPTLKDSPFRSAINEFIVTECLQQETISLTEEETDLLWETPE